MKLNLRALRKERDWTIDDLAEVSGLSRGYISQLETGKRQPGPETISLLCEVFSVTASTLIEDEYATDAPMIAVAGKVGAGAEVELVDAYAKGDGHRHVACPPQLSATGIVAVEVEGDSMVPMYQPGDILFYSRATHEGILEEDIGRACVVEDASGHAWVKQVKRGDEPGQFHLISLNPLAETRHNQRIKWAARVKLALPAEFVVRQM